MLIYFKQILDSDLPSMDFCGTIIILATPLPHSKVWGPVSSLNIEYKVLNKVDLICRVNDLGKEKKRC